MENFKKLNISEDIIEALKLQGITAPRTIQSKVIMPTLENKDIIAQSETGSGKTLAYVLPIFEKIDPSKRENQVIILTPTHELAVQVDKVIEKLSKDSKREVKSAVIIGNVNIKRQYDKLKKDKPHIIVGSAGRILELIKLKKISAHTIKTIVIDECDKLLDENNIENTKAVIKTTLKDRQLLCFSATVTEEVLNFGKETMKDPLIIKEENKVIVNENIEHIYVTCDIRDKILMVRKLVAALKPKKAIVFINDSNKIEVITDQLKYHNLKVQSISGANFKYDRKKAMDEFISGKSNLLVSSDLTSRGLDIRGVTHVINLDLPENPMDYIHRSGRCGRGKSKGISVSVVTKKELYEIKKLENKFNIKIALKDLYYGNIVNVEEKNLMKEYKRVNDKPKAKNKKDKYKDKNKKEVRSKDKKENNYWKNKHKENKK